GMLDALGNLALLDLAEIKPGRKIRALGGEHHDLDVVGDGREIGLDAEDRAIVERVTLFAARKPQRAHRPLPRGLERVGQALNLLVGRHPRRGFSHHADPQFAFATSGQPPSLSGRNACSASMVATTLNTSHSLLESAGVFTCNRYMG